jgi:tyrosyl-tRNA synthetase
MDSSMTKSGFLTEAKARGFVFQCTDEAALDEALRDSAVSAYIGFDPTGSSLHVGHMVQIMMLRLLQRHGHKTVALLGGGTSKIGDPSFREEARQLMTDAQIAENIAGIRRNIEPFLRFGNGPSDAILANNADWLDKLGYIELLREVGPHFSISRMLAFDSVKSRLDREQGLTFLEFNYSILQSYDFRELNRRHGVNLQMGGSDQWGNIVSGVDLVRRTDAKTVYGLTSPLITTASGAKMGKTAKGAVWLTAARTSPFDYWQFWRNTEDGDVGRFLRLFTDLPMEEAARLGGLGGAEINEAKKILATEATMLAHGADAARMAAETARLAFEEGAAAESLPGVTLPVEVLQAGIPAFAILVAAGLAATNGEARRLIRGGGARLNDVPFTEEAQIVSLSDLHDSALKLSAGRRQHRLVRVGD